MEDYLNIVNSYKYYFENITYDNLFINKYHNITNPFDIINDLLSEKRQIIILIHNEKNPFAILILNELQLKYKIIINSFYSLFINSKKLN